MIRNCLVGCWEDDVVIEVSLSCQGEAVCGGQGTRAGSVWEEEEYGEADTASVKGADTDMPRMR